MSKYEPIIIKPLTLRGVFGVAWSIYKRGFFAALVFTLAYVIVAAAVAFLPMLPAIGGFSSIIDNLDAGRYSYDAITGLAGIFSSSLLSMVSFAALYLLLMPIFYGTLYSDMSARIYGEAASVGGLFARMKYSLKRFFTTALAHWVANMAVGFVVGIFILILVFALAFSFFTVVANYGDTFDDISSIIGLMLLFSLLTGIVATVGTSFISFTFTVAVNENVRAFKAVGRSLKIACKKFGRVFGCQMTVFGIVFVVIAAFMLLCVELYWQAEILATVICIVTVLFTVLLTPYIMALNTALYFDIRTRMEGEDWLLYSAVKANADMAYRPNDRLIDSPYDSDTTVPECNADTGDCAQKGDYPQTSEFLTHDSNEQNSFGGSKPDEGNNDPYSNK